MLKLTIEKTDIAGLKVMVFPLIWAFPLVFMGLLPWLFARSPHWGLSYWWPALLSTILLSLYVVYPKGLYHPCRLWLAISGVIGWFNTRVILALAYYGLIMPIGFLMRNLGKLQYQSGKNKHKQHSFWIKRQDNNAKQNMKDPF